MTRSAEVVRARSEWRDRQLDGVSPELRAETEAALDRTLTASLDRLEDAVVELAGAIGVFRFMRWLERILVGG